MNVLHKKAYARMIVSLFLSIMLLTEMLFVPAHAVGTPIPVCVDLNSFDATNVGGDGASTLLWKKGDATTSAGDLRVVPANNNMSGTVVRRNKIKLNGGFSTYFVMRLNGGTIPPADGLVFIVQNNNTPQLGAYGGGLGYRGIANSFGVEFDIWNNTTSDGFGVYDGDIAGGAANHVAIVQNGSNDHRSANANTWSVPAFSLHGNDVHVWVDYAMDGTLQVAYGLTNDYSAATKFSKNVGTSLNNQDVYVGFAASTGGSTANHDIKKWYFKDNYVSGGLDPTTPGTYTQGANGVSITLNGGSTNPTTASIQVKDASNANMANENVDIYVDDVFKETASTGAGATYTYSFGALATGSHTVKVVAASGGATDTQSFNVTDTTAPAVGGGGTITVSNATYSSVDLNWTAATDLVTAQANLQYKVVYSTTNNISTTTNAEDIAIATVAQDWIANITSKQVTGLNPGTAYYFNVLVKDAAGNKAIYNTASQSALPSAPTGLTATAGNTQVALSWNSVSGATGYKVYKSITSGAYGAPLASVSQSVYSYDATGLTNGTLYYFVVRSTNAGNDSLNSNEVSAIPKTVPGASTGVTAAAGNGQATVSFTVPSDNGGSVITGYTVTSSPGNITATGSDSPITVTGLTNGTTYSFTVIAANAAGNSTASAPSNTVTPAAFSSSGGSNTTTQSTTPANTGVNILVNGKTENAGSATTTKEGEKTVTTITVDPQKLEQKLEKEGNNTVVTIPYNTKADVVVGELNGQMVKNMENKQSVIEVKTQTVTYTLPAQQIKIDAISEQIGKTVELKDIKVQIEISNSATDTVKVVENSSKKGEFTIVSPPVEFEVRCTYENKTVAVSSFNAYVERTLAIPDGVDPNKITTGIVVDPDGAVRHVPTRVVIIEGKYYAKINSLTNSAYSVIWHPYEFKDVEKHWAKEAVNDMGSRLVVGGVGNDLYEPDRDITRAEFAAIVVRGLGLRPGTGNNLFTDVKDTDWYSDYIKTASEFKIISGYGDGKFGPMDNITREQAMTMIARAMNITGLKVEFATGEAEMLFAGFSDSDKSAEWARNNIAACIKAGIVSGRSGKLVAPKDNISRAEVAVIVRILLQKSNLI